MKLSQATGALVDYDNVFLLSLLFRGDKGGQHRNGIGFRLNVDSFQDVADGLRDFADKLEARGKKPEFLKEDVRLKPLKAEDGLDGTEDV